MKTQTIFEDSPIGIDKWLTTMWMLVNCRNDYRWFPSAPLFQGIDVEATPDYFVMGFAKIGYKPCSSRRFQPDPHRLGKVRRSLENKLGILPSILLPKSALVLRKTMQTGEEPVKVALRLASLDL